MYQDLLYSKDNHVVTITLNRPEQRNALSSRLIDELVAALEEFRADDDARVLVLTGAGKSFCAGGDLRMMEQWMQGDTGKTPPDPSVTRARYRDGIHRVPILLETLDKPVLAAINGAAAGAGCDLALMADIRIASEEARFGEVFCKLGIAPGDGGCYFLPRIVGIEKACELIFTGDIIDAREALRIGMVSRVVPASELLPEIYKLAQRIANGAILAIRYSKQAIYRGLRESLQQNLEFIALAQSQLHATEDHAEGMQAFLEKREPKFKGR